MDVCRVGDRIYIPSVAFLTHGVDDVHGGLATVTAIYEKDSSLPETYVEVLERPGVRYAWITLARQQEDLRTRYGDQLAHSDPDARPQFNEGWPREPLK